MLIVSIKHGMVVDKVHEVILFKQSKWLEKYMNFNAQKRNWAKIDFEKASTNYSITHSMEKRRKILETE